MAGATAGEICTNTGLPHICRQIVCRIHAQRWNTSPSWACEGKDWEGADGKPPKMKILYYENEYSLCVVVASFPVHLALYPVQKKTGTWLMSTQHSDGKLDPFSDLAVESPASYLCLGTRECMRAYPCYASNYDITLAVAWIMIQFWNHMIQESHPVLQLAYLSPLLHLCMHAHMHAHTHTHAHTHIIVTFPRWSSMSAKGECCSVWGNLLDATPSNPLPHPLSPPPILLHVIWGQRLGC